MTNDVLTFSVAEDDETAVQHDGADQVPLPLPGTRVNKTVCQEAVSKTPGGEKTPLLACEGLKDLVQKEILKLEDRMQHGQEDASKGMTEDETGLSDDQKDQNGSDVAAQCPHGDIMESPRRIKLIQHQTVPVGWKLELNQHNKKVAVGWNQEACQSDRERGKLNESNHLGDHPLDPPPPAQFLGDDQSGLHHQNVLQPGPWSL